MAFPYLIAAQIGIPLLSSIAEARDARKAARKNKKAIALANLRNAVNPSARHEPNLVETEPSLLTSLAQGAEMGLGAYNTVSALQAAKDMQALQRQAAALGVQTAGNELAQQQGAGLFAQQQMGQDRLAQLRLQQPSGIQAAPPSFLTGIAQQQQAQRPVTPQGAAGYLRAQREQELGTINLRQQFEQQEREREKLRILEQDKRDEALRWQQEQRLKEEESKAQTEYRRAAMQALQAKTEAPAGPKMEDVRKGEDDLRKEVTAFTKDVRVIRDSYAAIQAAARNPSPAGDIAIVFGYMKMLDPASTVREGEFATAQNAGSVPENIMNVYNRVLKGERLGKTRPDFLNQARTQYETRMANIRPQIEWYKRLAVDRGLDPAAIFFDIELPETPNMDRVRSTLFNLESALGDETGRSW